MNTMLTTMRTLLLTTPLLLLLVTGCEESVSDPTITFPYVEEIVVQGFITADADDTLFISRTLPPLERWTLEKGAIREGEVFVTVDGERKEYRHVLDGLWVPDGWQAEPGKRYELTVRVGELVVRSNVVIPETSTSAPGFRFDTVDAYYPDEPVSDDITCIDGVVSLKASAADRDLLRLSYDLSISFNDGLGTENRYRQGEQWIFDTEWIDGELRGRFTTFCTFPGDQFTRTIDTLFLLAVRYDSTYIRFRNSSDDDDDFFGPTTSDREWNVSGDGFGWFLPRAVRRDTVVFE